MQTPRLCPRQVALTGVHRVFLLVLSLAASVQRLQSLHLGSGCLDSTQVYTLLGFYPNDSLMLVYLVLQDELYPPLFLSKRKSLVCLAKAERQLPLLARC